MFYFCLLLSVYCCCCDQIRSFVERFHLCCGERECVEEYVEEGVVAVAECVGACVVPRALP